MTGLLSWIVMGLIAGYLGKLLHPGKDGGGVLVTILLGIGGALVGGLIGVHLLKIGTVGDFSLQSIGLATGGSVVLLFLYRMFGSRLG